MGKYIRKAKAAGELAVMEATQSSLGVRTRAKTLASQRLQKSPPSNSNPQPAPPPPPPPTAPAAAASSGSYLQLRSRRLPKPPILVRSHYSKRQRKVGPSAKSPSAGSSPNPRSRSRLRVGSMESVGSYLSNSEGGGDKNKSGEEAKDGIPGEVNAVENDNECSSNADLGVGEASFGDNVLEFEGRERSTRESTPCSLIRDPEAVRTPSSTTRPTTLTETNRRIHNVDGRHIPTTHEMDEFFAGAEEEQQRNFIEKYNFDPVNDKPLPGRFEWQKLDP
ncbi:hypothetical protein BT93_H3908 [Corymbia citriodora subsp. variegata]|nr:hypothetical protein BT93_H3908 [Corymbia citriodora subsp. variegata]